MTTATVMLLSSLADSQADASLCSKMMRKISLVTEKSFLAPLKKNSAQKCHLDLARQRSYLRICWRGLSVFFLNLTEWRA